MVFKFLEKCFFLYTSVVNCSIILTLNNDINKSLTNKKGSLMITLNKVNLYKI